jgi:hypothetical protein
MNDKINELFDYIKCGKRDCNSRIESLAVKKLSEILSLEHNNDTILFFITNYKNIHYKNRVDDIFRFFSTQGDDRGIVFLKNIKKDDEKILSEKYLKKENVFIEQLEDFGCNVKKQNMCFEISKNNKIIRESLAIMEYVSAKDLLISRGLKNESLY